MTTRAQTVTILFTDLVGSTELLQRAGDERAQRIFKAHHRLLREAVDQHGGHEVKWLGDGLMVAFDSARDAALCAIAMQQASRRPAAGERLQIRAGLHVGEAFKDESDYFGTSVVIARRLCDRADAGQIFASDLVVRLLDGRQEIAFADLGALPLKGIEQPVHAHELRYEHDPLAMLAVTPFVGRDDVVAALSAKLEQARAGKGSLVMLVGEPGIGKTRTATEFCEAARQAGALVLWGRCYDGEWAAPFSPFMEAIREYAGAAPVDELKSMLGAEAGVLARIVPVLHERIPDLAEPPAIPAEGERYRLLEAAGDFFARLAASKPLVLMLDDLHWADKGTIAMLRQVARLAPQQRLLIVGAYRDVELDRAHPLADALQTLRRETNYERIVLKGLEASDVSDLLTLVAEQDVPETFARAIGDETGGNPFFIREVMLHLVEEGRIVQEDGRWTATAAIGEMRIPEGVREVIGRRLSRVSEPCGRMLTVASALTAGFSWEVISALVDVGDAALLDAIDEALGAQLIVERERNRYEFTHALIRHTLYEELSTPRRVLLHRQIGEALEQLYGGAVEPHLAELAHHFYECANALPGKASEYCRRAGDSAMQLYAFDEAAGQYARALEVAASYASLSDELHARLLLARGVAEFCAGLLEESDATFLRAADAARTSRSPELLARAALGGLRMWAWHEAALVPLLKEALETLPSGDSALRACVMANIAWRDGFIDSREEQTAFAEAAVAMASRVRDQDAVAYTMIWRGWPVAFGPNSDWFDPAIRLAVFDEIIRLGQEVGDKHVELVGHHWRTNYALEYGDKARFDQEIDTYIRIAAEARAPIYQWIAASLDVLRLFMAGDHERAQSRIPELVAFEVRHPTAYRYSNSAVLALLYHRGLMEAVLDQLDEFVETNPPARCVRALALIETGRLDDARRDLHWLEEHELGVTTDADNLFWMSFLPAVCRALCADRLSAELYDRLAAFHDQNLHFGQTVYVGSVSGRLGVLAATTERFADAQRHFEDALAMEARMGARPWVTRTQLDYARMLLKRDAAGDRDRARELLDAALATAREIGMAKVEKDCIALLSDG